MTPINSLLTMTPLNMAGPHGSGVMAGGAMGGGFFPFFPLLGWIVTLLVIGLVVYVLVRTFKQDRPEAGEQMDSALKLLRQRYASGEIDEEEYRSRKASLES